MGKPFGIHFGVLCDPIKTQLEKQGICRVKDEQVAGWQSMADAIVNLYMDDILTDSEIRKARGRLMKLITRDLNAIGKEQPHD